MSSSSFEEILEKEGHLIYSNVGDSMLPLIRQNRDLVVIERPAGRLRKFDVPLSRRDRGERAGGPGRVRGDHPQPGSRGQGRAEAALPVDGGYTCI